MNPYDLQAAPFLALYAALMCLGVGFAFIERRRERPTVPTPRTEGLDAVELAYLAGGAGRAVDTVVVGLLQANAATFNRSRCEIVATPPSPGLPDFLSRCALMMQRPLHVRGLTRDLQPLLEELRQGLVARGVAYGRQQARAIAFQSAIPLLLLTCFGVIRVLLGAKRGHPVGYIFLLTLATLLTSLWFLTRPPVCRRAGRAALHDLREKHRRLMRAPMDKELTLALALAGYAVLKGTPYAAYATLRTAANGGDGGSGGSGCGGGGGGGCGGCGGG